MTVLTVPTTENIATWETTPETLLDQQVRADWLIATWDGLDYPPQFEHSVLAHIGRVVWRRVTDAHLDGSSVHYIVDGVTRTDFAYWPIVLGRADTIPTHSEE